MSICFSVLELQVVKMCQFVDGHPVVTEMFIPVNEFKCQRPILFRQTMHINIFLFLLALDTTICRLIHPSL